MRPTAEFERRTADFGVQLTIHLSKRSLDSNINEPNLKESIVAYPKLNGPHVT